MDSQTCKTCAHYRQHYHYDGERCFVVNCGHCVYPRLKTRQPNTKACGNYLPRQEQPLPRIVDFPTLERLRRVLEEEE